MNELVTIKRTVIGDSKVNSVDARELYERLDLNKAHWSRWARQNIFENTFAIEHDDWEGFTIVVNGNEVANYALSLQFAKKLAMQVRTKEGEKVRDYFLKCEKVIEDTINLQGAPSALKELVDIQLMTTRYLSEMLHYSEASTLDMVHRIHKEHGLPVGYLPKYAENQRVCFSMTDLLKKNGIKCTAKRMNEMLIDIGFLEEKERRSTSKGTKKFKALTGTGLQFGQNCVSPNKKNEVQPRYYEDKFMELINDYIGDWNVGL